MNEHLKDKGNGPKHRAQDEEPCTKITATWEETGTIVVNEANPRLCSYKNCTHLNAGHGCRQFNEVVYSDDKDDVWDRYLKRCDKCIERYGGIPAPVKPCGFIKYKDCQMCRECEHHDECMPVSGEKGG